jgi:conjugative relaxase-like TrwC/TraI family protein
MLSISPAKRAKEVMTYSHRDIEQGSGEWLGEGSKRLALTSPIAAEPFARMLAGVDQQGNRLVQNAAQPNRRAGWDLVFSAPKSVSLAWAFDVPNAQVVAKAHRRSVETAIQGLEAMVTIGRRGKAGRIREAACAVVARFPHRTSRENDPQLHDHCLVINLAGFSDGGWGALEPRPIFQAQLALGALYRAALARELSNAGYPIEPDNESFRVASVPHRLEECFSSRRRQIRQRLTQLQHATPRAAEIATLDTRSPKEELPLDELFFRWNAKAEELGIQRGESQNWRFHPKPTAPVTLPDLIDTSQTPSSRHEWQELTRKLVGLQTDGEEVATVDTADDEDAQLNEEMEPEAPFQP